MPMFADAHISSLRYLSQFFWNITEPGLEPGQEPGWSLDSGRKNVLRKLLRISYRRLKAGFFVC